MNSFANFTNNVDFISCCFVAFNYQIFRVKYFQKFVQDYVGCLLVCFFFLTKYIIEMKACFIVFPLGDTHIWGD